ncbi:MAG: serine hydrolase domain-containing protein [Elusimicrobiales bacterium]
MGNIRRQVDKLFLEWDRKDSPGCALGVVSKGTFVYKRCYGMASLEHGAPITPDSVFDVGSTSKQFTAACIALLAMRRKLSLDDRIQKYLPEIPRYESPITIRHLIHHTSGLRDYLTLMYLRGMRFENEYSDKEIFGTIARQKKLNFLPGSEHLYCNTGYLLLGEIVKRVSGKTLRCYAQEQIFSPLGMKNTHFHDDLAEIVKGRAAGHNKGKAGHKLATSLFDVVGDGALHTTLNDLAIWDGNFYDNRVGGFGRKLIEQITALGRLNDGKALNYASGLFVEEYRGLKSIHHGGSWIGYKAEMVRFPGQELSVICLANTEAIDAISMARKVADLYLADKFTVPRPRLPLASSSKRRPIIGKPGYYEHGKDGDLALFSGKGGYSLELGGIIHKLDRITSAKLQAKSGAVEVDFSGPGEFTLTRRNGQKSIYSRIPRMKKGRTPGAKLAGDYYCPELNTTYKVNSRGTRLETVIADPGEDLLDLEPVKPGLFKAERYLTVQFNKSCRSFSLGAGRVKDLMFVKKGRGR